MEFIVLREQANLHRLLLSRIYSREVFATVVILYIILHPEYLSGFLLHPHLVDILRIEMNLTLAVLIKQSEIHCLRKETFLIKDVLTK